MVTTFAPAAPAVKTTRPAPAVKTTRRRPYLARFCELVTWPCGCHNLSIRVIVNARRETFDCYVFAELDRCDYGRGFELTKSDGTTYFVNVAGESRTCTCVGHEAHGHCKHADAVAALMEAGKLAPAGGANPEPTTREAGYGEYGDDVFDAMAAVWFGDLEAEADACHCRCF